MTSKKYVEGIKIRLDSEIQDIDKKIAKNEKLFNAGTIVTGILGACCLFGSPFFAIPVLTGAYALQMTKKNYQAVANNSKNRYLGEKNHLISVLKNGLNISSKTNKHRKAKMDQIQRDRVHLGQDYQAALSSRYFGNALVAGSIAVAGLFGGPILAFAPLAALALKKKFDQNLVEKHKAFEDSASQFNQLAHDYNISIYANQNRKVQQKSQPVFNGSEKQHERAAAKRVVYDSEAEEAVDQYIRGLENEKRQEEGFQKRKI